VVLFHFNGTLKLGYIGVDLFFVISGLLVGGLLMNQYKEGKSVNFWKFILQRGFKIWPSYYCFLLIGSLLARWMYKDLDPDQIIPLNDLKRYLLFYQNYTGAPFHWSFDHVWSLCVEEHFYIILPLVFIFSKLIFKDKENVLYFVMMLIVAGILFKVASLYLTTGKDTYSATHNRIDALAWGVLLSYIVYFKRHFLEKKFVSALFLPLGLVLFTGLLWLKLSYDNIIFQQILFHSLLPLSFFLMMGGLYFKNFARLGILRVIAYYSYNWYLWHAVFSIFFLKHFGYTLLGFCMYMMISFFCAVLFTILIEEFFLSIRSRVIKKIFSSPLPVGTSK
jgi:peptidoglycan/LPS O-acetylase OafA/YrhL